MAVAAFAAAVGAAIATARSTRTSARVFCSKTSRSENVAALREMIIAFFEAAMVEDQIVLPYAKQGLLGDVYDNGPRTFMIRPVVS